MKIKNFLLSMLCCSMLSSFCIANTPCVFVLVHGSWHGDWAWFNLEHKLKAKGYKTICVNLPAHGTDSTAHKNVSLEDYKLSVLEVIDRQTQPVILVGHSMGGIVVSEVAEARPEKIWKLVYLSAFLLQDGQTMFELALQDNESLIFPNLTIDSLAGHATINKDKVRSIFFNKTKENLIILSKKLLTPEPIVPLKTPISISDENYGSVPRYYIKTLKDKAIGSKTQTKMYRAMPCEEVFCINTDHSAFFSSTKKLRNLLIKIAEENYYYTPPKEVFAVPLGI